MNKLSLVFLSMGFVAGAAQSQSNNSLVSSDGTSWKSGSGDCWAYASGTSSSGKTNCVEAPAKSAAVVGSAGTSKPMAANTAPVQAPSNWVSSDGTVWKNGSNEFCWRNSSWTAATANPSCDGAEVKKAAAPVVAPAPVAVVAPPVAAAPALAVPSKVTFAAATFFDFDKAVLKPEGKAQLDELLTKLSSVKWDVLVAVGHTDSRGSDEYNQALSQRRAEAVKAYLVTKGLNQQQVKTDGKGESMPVADNSTAAGRAKNRRVEIEVVGTSK